MSHRVLVLLAIAGAWWPAIGWTEPRTAVRVVAGEAADARMPHLMVQLRLHASADVRAVAARGAVDAHAMWLWLAPAPGGGTVAYAAGPAPDSAVFELVRVDAGLGHDELARIVALKAGARIDALAARPAARPSTRPTPPVARRGAAPPPRTARVELGTVVAAAGDRRALAGIAVAADHAVVDGPARIALGPALRWWPASGLAVPGATLEIAEVGAALVVTAALERRGIAAFGALGGGGSLFTARAWTADGRDGGRRIAVPGIAAGVGVRLPLSDAVHLVVAVDREWWLVRQRFLVDGTVAADLGAARWRASAALSIPLW